MIRPQRVVCGFNVVRLSRGFIAFPRRTRGSRVWPLRARADDERFRQLQAIRDRRGVDTLELMNADHILLEGRNPAFGHQGLQPQGLAEAAGSPGRIADARRRRRRPTRPRSRSWRRSS